IEVVSAGEHSEDIAEILADDVAGSASKSWIAEVSRNGPGEHFAKQGHRALAGIVEVGVTIIVDQLQYLLLQSYILSRSHRSVGFAANQVDVEVDCWARGYCANFVGRNSTGGQQVADANCCMERIESVVGNHKDVAFQFTCAVSYSIHNASHALVGNLISMFDVAGVTGHFRGVLTSQNAVRILRIGGLAGINQ